MKMTCCRNVPPALSIHALTERRDIETHTNGTSKTSIHYGIDAQGTWAFYTSFLEEFYLTPLETRLDHVHFLDQHSRTRQHVIRHWGVDAAIDRIEHHLLNAAR
jgi:hypothetical protein